jgi:hypothetical protein
MNADAMRRPWMWGGPGPTMSVVVLTAVYGVDLFGGYGAVLIKPAVEQTQLSQPSRPRRPVRRGFIVRLRP